MRAPFQVLVFPYIQTPQGIEYAVFRRSDAGYWQGIAGGGEEGETPLEAALREAWEEGGIPTESAYLALDTVNSIPVLDVVDDFLWGEDVLVMKEYCFGVKISGKDMRLSHEHTAFAWKNYEEARACLKWDSNKTALWELNLRLHLPGFRFARKAGKSNP